MDQRQLRNVLLSLVVVLIAAIAAILTIPSAEKRDARPLPVEQAPELELDDPVLKKGVAKRDKDQTEGVSRVRRASGTARSGEKFRYDAQRPEQATVTLGDSEGVTEQVRTSAAGTGGLLVVSTDDTSAAHAQQLARELLTDSSIEISGSGKQLTLRSDKLVSSGVSVKAGKQLTFRDLYPRAACAELKVASGLRNSALVAACDASGVKIKGLER